MKEEYKNRIIRFGVSLDSKLLKKFDEYIKNKNYNNRSYAIANLIKKELSKIEPDLNSEITGILAIVYNHHTRELVNKLIELQHHFKGKILSSIHIHLNEQDCLEIIIINGKNIDIKKLNDNIEVLKGIKFFSFQPVCF